MPSGTCIRIFPTPDGVVQHAARTLRDACSAHRERRVCIALSGGSTPARLYRFLAEDFRREIPWERLEVFFGDERCVPPEHPDSNYRLAHVELLSRVPIPEAQVHRMPADAADPAAGVDDYEDLIARLVPTGPLGEPSFDIVWLGLGEDGHTASLFPGTAALDVGDRLVAFNEVPQLDARRMTFTYPLLNAGAVVQFLVLGGQKAPVVTRILGPTARKSGADLAPAARVRPAYGRVEWLLDREASAGITEQGLLA